MNPSLSSTISADFNQFNIPCQIITSIFMAIMSRAIKDVAFATMFASKIIASIWIWSSVDHKPVSDWSMMFVFAFHLEAEKARQIFSSDRWPSSHPGDVFGFKK